MPSQLPTVLFSVDLLQMRFGLRALGRLCVPGGLSARLAVPRPGVWRVSRVRGVLVLLESLGLAVLVVRSVLAAL
ncbi:MAG: hypothetical protein AAF368_03240 [Planctomycetota bacterium]